MTGDTNNGGQAFPAADCGQGFPYEGMSLRDYFAIHAPKVSDEQVIADIPGFPEFDNSGYFNGLPAQSILDGQTRQKYAWLREARIRWRYEFADAMIAAREGSAK